MFSARSLLEWSVGDWNYLIAVFITALLLLFGTVVGKMLTGIAYIDFTVFI